MAGFNNVVLLGNLTRDPELRYIASGTAVCDCSIAVNEKVKKGNDWVDEVHFFDLTIWGRRAEVVNEYLGKGSQILVKGKLRQERWEKDGRKHSKVKVNVDEVTMLGSNRKSEGGGSSSRSADYHGTADDEEDPF